MTEVTGNGTTPVAVDNGTQVSSTVINMQTNNTQQDHTTEQTDQTAMVVPVNNATQVEMERRPHCHTGNCCMRTRQCLESSVFSFTLGAVLFIGGVTLIAVASKLPSGDYFLIGPFCVAAGVIFLIRGCINKLAQRQQRREEEAQAARVERRHLTREERSQRYEQQALSQENLIIPPDYYDVIPTPPSNVPSVKRSHRPAMVSQMSQCEFDNQGSLRRHMTTQATGTHVGLNRLNSVQSQTQTSFPSLMMIDMAVDTSDLPTSPDGISLPPPSYLAATSPRHTQTDLNSQYSVITMREEQRQQNTGTSTSTGTGTSDASTTAGGGVTVFLPDDEDNG